ncbi:MAG TPA: tocopherol cyclase family protein [Aggregatilinea sp.]|uniref:tocopherol cyclase family protein n=1 Tax=Aggregatilinea sp. TaxID=2806333 RepID=UPI002B8814D7|nr:tocopherol cyclase family protein [Aggregatilinea sp.]HML22689.1 tocopherol cyclase family protein [Aggregatilinea sp.]
MNLSTLWKPAVYHGDGKRPPYFEGWYFKLIDAAGARRYAIIPGIFKHADPTQAHAFVQILDGAAGTSIYKRYPADAFHASADVFDVRVGPNHFGPDGIVLDVEHEGQSVRGAVTFAGVTPWPVTRLSPGVMGWYGLVPLMECYHGVLSFDHGLAGALDIDGTPVGFAGGRGYTEKDWGQAFPRGYIWMQSNHFEPVGTSLTASVALIPWLWQAFRGFIVGLRHEGALYRFATYTGARVERLDVTDTHVYWTMSGVTGPADRRGRYRLAIDAERASGGLLHAPDRVAMVERIVESLTASIGVRLVMLDGKREREVFAGTGQFGGLELGGDLSTILDGYDS